MHPNILTRARTARAALPAVSLAALALCGSITPLGAQSAFEGVITIATHGRQGDVSSMQYMLRDGKMRMDFAAGGAMSAIVDPKAEKMYVVMAPQRMYMERSITIDDAARATASSKAEITKTGRKETIAGYECEHWTITDAGEQYDACVAKGLGTFFQGESALARHGAPQWFEELKDGLFPLRVARANGETVLEVTRIERKPMDASLFAVPAGFRKVDMPAGLMRRP